MEIFRHKYNQLKTVYPYVHYISILPIPYILRGDQFFNQYSTLIIPTLWSKDLSMNIAFIKIELIGFGQ
jgi:hypothetical protein